MGYKAESIMADWQPLESLIEGLSASSTSKPPDPRPSTDGARAPLFWSGLDLLVPLFINGPSVAPLDSTLPARVVARR